MSELKQLMPERIPSFGAVFYDLVPAKIFLPHYRMVAREVSAVAKGAILDIGTGPGILPLEIARLLPATRIIGIDVSEKMIAIARKHNRRRYGLGNVEFRVMNANALAFEDCSLDMVISTGSFHHWKDAAKIFDQIYRCLKAGCEAWIYDGLAEATDQDIDAGIARIGGFFPSRGLARRILRIHGFSQKEYDTVVKNTVAGTRFKTCLFEKCGIMMRMRLRKA